MKGNDDLTQFAKKYFGVRLFPYQIEALKAMKMGGIKKCIHCGTFNSQRLCRKCMMKAAALVDKRVTMSEAIMILGSNKND